jgi:hypothetical protein
MQNQNWRFSRVIAVATVTLLVVSFTTLAVAQRIAGQDRQAIFSAAPKVSTSVKGVSAFAASTKGFNPLNASNAELLSHGLPQRPDQANEPKQYKLWERAMLAMKTRATDVRARPYTSRQMMGGVQTHADIPDANGYVFFNSGNWSGIANFNTLHSWSTTASFDEVLSYWPVPVANHPFGNLPCSEGPWFEVTWNGIDGFNNGDVAQGGSLDYWDDGGCGGPVIYEGWIEWFPSYSILAIFCGSNPCPVGPGDAFVVETIASSGFNAQTVFIEDIEQQWFGTFSLSYVSGPPMVGSSAEQIVERPCCNGSNLYPLGNYIFEWFDDAVAYNTSGHQFFPGSSNLHTAVITMLADDNSTPISTPLFYGSSGNQGKYSIWMEDENCAYSGGCTP